MKFVIILDMDQIRELSLQTIFALRKKLGLTQEQFGHVIGVTGRTVCLWETGQTKPSRLAVKVIRRVFKEEMENSTKEA